MYKILYTLNFERSFAKLDKYIQYRVKEKIEQLSENPQLIKKLKYSPKEFGSLCKYRVGDWRILFWVDHNKEEITLYLVDRRDSAYKNL